MVDIGGIAGDTLRSYIERIERLEAEKTALTADIREIFSEAKGNGFDAKIMRQIVSLIQISQVYISVTHYQVHSLKVILWQLT